MTRKPVALRAGKKVGGSTTTSAARPHITVVLVPRRGLGVPARGTSWSENTVFDPVDRYYQLLDIIRPFIELHSVVDAVFTEDNAFAEAAKQYGYGRIYEAWKKARQVLDPEYDPEEDDRDRAGATVRGNTTRVLRPRTRRPRGGRSFGP